MNENNLESAQSALDVHKCAYTDDRLNSQKINK